MRMDRVRGAVLAAFLGGAVIGGGGAVAQREAPAATVQALVPAGTADGFSITVDLSDRMLYVMRGGEVEREYRVAIGRPRHPTPTGSFNVRRLVWNPRWVPPDAAWARNRRAREPGDPRTPWGA